jgi:hypothetical protein
LSHNKTVQHTIKEIWCGKFVKVTKINTRISAIMYLHFLLLVPYVFRH